MDINAVKEVWCKVKDELEKTLPEHIFYTWITPLEAVDYENSTLVLLSPHPMAVDILKKNWTDKIKASVFLVLMLLFRFLMILNLLTSTSKLEKKSYQRGLQVKQKKNVKLKMLKFLLLKCNPVLT